jgi:hypothetical protein
MKLSEQSECEAYSDRQGENENKESNSHMNWTLNYGVSLFFHLKTEPGTVALSFLHWLGQAIPASTLYKYKDEVDKYTMAVDKYMSKLQNKRPAMKKEATLN